jgi:aspartyl/asparaginyl beta-hydroxylase (cupin superfamily)
VREPETVERVAAPPVYYRTDGPYRGGTPCFYDVDRLDWCRSWADRVRESWTAIRDEFERNVRRGTDRVTEVFNPAGPAVPGWRSVNLQTYSWPFRAARRAFPVTVGVLDSIPGLTSAFINVLAPGSAIGAHFGDSDAIVRFHLGLDVPTGDCAIRVGGATRRSADGRLLAFSDAHEHSSWNATDATRVVLVFDVLRPEHRRRRRWICANVLAATAVVWLEARLARVRRVDTTALHRVGRTVPLPQPLRTALRRTIALGIHLVLLVRGS